MNKNYNSSSIKEAYVAPSCETHVIVPEGMICESGLEYGPGDQNDNGGWL